MVEINEGGMEDIGSHKNHRELFKPFQSPHSSTFKFYIFIPKSNYLKGSFELLCLVIHNDKLVVESKSLEICSNFSRYLHHGY
jgi:hypothetical protein